MPRLTNTPRTLSPPATAGCFSMVHPGNTYGIYWTHKPPKDDLQETDPRRRIFQPFRYQWEARRDGQTSNTGVEKVYCTSELVFHQLIAAWNCYGRQGAPLNPGLAWLYCALDPQGGAETLH